MKKKFLAIMLLSFCLTACGKEEKQEVEYENSEAIKEVKEMGGKEKGQVNKEREKPDSSSLMEEITNNADKYVKLGEYRNVIEIPENDRTVTAEDVENVLQEYLISYQEYYCEHDEGVVESDSKVGIQYKITDDKNGAEEYPEQVVYIGDDYMGLDSVLIGKNTGEEFSSVYTYPDDWWDEETAGKEANVSGKILYILGAPLYDEVTDEFIKEMTGGEYDNVDEFRVVQKNQLESYKRFDYGYNALTNVVATSEFTDIDKLVEEERNQMISDFEYSYDTSDSDKEIYENFGYETEEEYVAWVSEQAEHNIKDMLVVNALAKELSLELTQDDINDYIQQIGAYYEEDGLVDEMANDPDIRYSLLCEKVVNKLFDLQ